MSPKKKSALSDTNPQTLTKKQENAVELWFQNVTNQIEADLLLKTESQPSPHTENRVLSLFGLKHSRDVILFLKTKAGRGYIAEVLKAASINQANLTNAQNAAAEKARQQQLAMTLIALEYKEEKAETKAEYAREQAAIDKQLQQKPKTTTVAVNPVRTRAFDRAAHKLAEKSLHDRLASKQTDLVALEAEWLSLEDILDHEDKLQVLLDRVDGDTSHLLDLSAEEEALLDDETKALIHSLKQDMEILCDGDTYYLVPKGKTLEDLEFNPEEKEAAAKALNTLMPQLKDIHQTLNRAHVDKKAASTQTLRRYLERSVLLHFELVTLSNQLTVMSQALHALTPNQQQAPEAEADTPENRNNHMMLSRSYNLFMKEMRQGRVTSEMLHMDPQQVKALQQDVTTSNRLGVNIKLPEEIALKQGGSAEPQFSRIELLSLIKFAESFHAKIAESGTSRQFHIQEEMLSPKPSPSTDRQNEEEQRHELPSAFSTTPKPRPK